MVSRSTLQSAMIEEQAVLALAVITLSISAAAFTERQAYGCPLGLMISRFTTPTFICVEYHLLREIREGSRLIQ